MPTKKAVTAPSSVREFCTRRLQEGVGLFCVLAAVFIAVSLLSFHGADPSFNQTGGEQIHNSGGVIGAYIADLLLQTVGLASVLVVLCGLTWSWRLISKQRVYGWWLKVTALLVALVLVSALLAFSAGWDGWPIQTGLGGSIGYIVHAELKGLLSVWGMTALMAALSIAALPLAFGLRRQEWLAIGLLFGAAGNWLWHGVLLVRDALRGVVAEDDDDTEDEAPAKDHKTGRARVREGTANAPKLQLKKIPAKAVVERRKDQAEEDEDEETQGAFDLSAYDGDYELPSYNLLTKMPAKARKKKISEASLSQNASLLEQTLVDFGVKGEITRVRPGPVVTLYELEPSAGTKSSRVIGLADDIARSMSATSARISVVQGKNALGIEMPNSERETVYLREMLEHDAYKNSHAKLPLVLGKDIGGDPVIADLARMPHLLVAGTTGSGKSVAINTMIMSLIYRLTPDQCKFIMIDPKMLELSVYDDIPHLLSPVVTEPSKAVVALKWTVKEMENRYRLMSNLGVRNIENYNKRIREAAEKGEELFRTVQTGFDPETGKPVMEKVAIDMNPLPLIVVMVDEMADLMLVSGKEIETSIQRLAQMARAAGIHIIMATQRPSVDVITGVIKANFPTRVSFQVTSKIDSRTILGEQGAEQLLGQGDMLFMAGGGRIQRVHGPFISDKEVDKIVSFLRTQGDPVYVEDVTREDESAGYSGEGGDGDDEEKALYDQAVEIVLRDQKASTSYIQRKLKIGYNRAARLIEQMEEDGIVGQANHIGKREVLHRAAS